MTSRSRLGALVGTLWAVSCVYGALAADWHTDEHEAAFIGWKGEVEVGHLGSASGQGDAWIQHGHGWVQQLSWKPRVYLYHNFISEDEARHLRKLAAPQMRRASGGVEVTSRASYSAILRRLSDPVVERVSQRVAEWVQVPPVHQEDVQVLKHGVGHKYVPNMEGQIDESPRMATVLVYLADAEEGGETVFPDGSEWLDDQVQEAVGSGLSSCASSGGVAARPRLGDALLVYGLRPDGTYDGLAQPIGCPLIKGHKWTASWFVHSLPFRPKQYVAPTSQPDDPGICKDNQPSCKQWAESGECEKNAAYMVGGAGRGAGECRASCGACQVCAEGDVECWRQNREKGGWLLYDPTNFL